MGWTACDTSPVCQPVLGHLTDGHGGKWGNPRCCPEVGPMGAGPYGHLLGMVLFGLQPHQHPGTGGKGMASTPVAGDGSRNSALLPPQLGPPAPTFSSTAEGHTGLHWLHWAPFPMTSRLQEAVSWAAPWWSVSPNPPPAQPLPLPPHPSLAEMAAGTQG